MKDSAKGGLWFIGIVVVSFILGDFLMKAAFFGCLMLAGLVVMLNSMPGIKRVVARMSKVLDVIIWIFTLVATAQFGLNITAALTVAGIGFTLWYAPSIREEFAVIKDEQKPLSNYRDKYDCR